MEYLREQHPAGRQPIEIRRVNTLSPTHAVDPVVQIVHRNKQNVELFGRLFFRKCGRRKRKADGQ